MTLILDGKEYAKKLRSRLSNEVLKQKTQYDVHIGLAVVIVGDDPASHVYVNNKEIAATEVGIKSFVHRLPIETTQDALERLIGDLNNDKNVHGILVQMPLPKHLNEYQAIDKIHPSKDVDGFHKVNVGLLHGSGGQRGLRACTPQGCIELLSTVCKDLSGKHAVVIGRSHIVGRPVAEMLLQKNATVTIAHSKTDNLKQICLQADIIVAAVGRPYFVKQDWVKEGAVILDVGINRITTESGKYKLVGDVDFENVKHKAHAITPVPGGVGPMTIAFLLHNTVCAGYLLAGHREALEEYLKDMSL